MHLRDSLIPKYGELVYYGYLVCAGTPGPAGAGDGEQKNVTGIVRVKLYKGNIINAGRKSPRQPLQSAYRDDGSGSDEGLQSG